MLCKKCGQEIDNTFVYCPLCGKKQMKTTGPKPLRRANGLGTVYKLSGRRKRPWVAAINKRIVGYYEERTEALRALEAVVVNGFPDGYNDTLQDIYQRWKDAHYRDLTVKGREGYEIAWKRLSPLYGRKMRSIKTVDFQRIVDTAMTKATDPEKARPLSRSGKEKIKQLCSQLCKQAMQDEIINRNFGEFIKLEREEKKEKEIFTTAEIERLKENDSKTARIILTLIYTGFRINELFEIRREDVHLEENYIVGGKKTEAGRNRIVPINASIRPYIEDWHKSVNLYLVTSTTGKQIDDKNFRNREYYPLLEQLNIKRKNPHCTRHTFATMMSSAGVAPEVLQKIIGHAKFSTTAEIYIHKDISELQEAISKIC